MSVFATILEYIILFFQFVFGMIKSLATGIALIFSSLAFNSVFVGFMPTFLGSCFAVVLGIFLLRFFIGRD